MVDYGLLPPEINSGRIYAGPGAGPLLAAASAWGGLADDLQAVAAGHRSVIDALLSGPWTGPASASALAAVSPYIAWLDTSAEEAADAAVRASAAATAFEAAFTASIPPPVIAANRALLAVLVATNFFGQNTPAIAATEAQYLEFWAQDAAAMYAYAGSSAAATDLAELPAPAEVVNPGGLVDQAISVFKAQNQALQGEIVKVASQVNLRVSDVLKTISTPLNGTAIDQWLVANTPLDDLPPLVSKYLTPYLPVYQALAQSGQAFGQASSGSLAITTFMNNLAPAAKAVSGAAQAAGAAASKVGSVTGGLGQSVPIGRLSVPVSWTSATGTATPAVTVSSVTSVPAAVEGVAASNTPVAPPFGQFFNAGNGRKTPAYGHRLTFMTRPPAAG